MAQPLISSALASYPGVQHVKVEDGSGRPLGRSFRIKLWPTLVFLQGGREVTRLTRPQDGKLIEQALQALMAGAATSTEPAARE